MPRHPETEANRKRNKLLIRAREGRLSPHHHRQPMSRSEFADAVNVALSALYPDRQNLASFYVDYRWVGKLERGEHHWASTERRAALRDVTGAATDGELGLHKPRNPDRLTSGDAPLESIGGGGLKPSGGGSSLSDEPDNMTSPPDNCPESLHPGSTQVESDGDSDEDPIPILRRVDSLNRKIDPSILASLQGNLQHVLTKYETLKHRGLRDNLNTQRAWITSLLNDCRHPHQQRELFQMGAATAGVLGYIAVGRSDFPAARAYCLEAFTMGDLAEDPNLQAWARGLQSFCEYYSRDYAAALSLATDGMAYARSGPQSVRLTINGAARALGKLGDAEGVHRSVDNAFDLLSRNDAPSGVPSSIALECYSAAQTASNAATAYVSLGLPDKVQYFIDLALPEISKSASPWSRSLVAIDLASSLIYSNKSDLDRSVDLITGALRISQHRPVISVRQRVEEFVRDATTRWGRNVHIDAVRDALVVTGGARR